MNNVLINGEDRCQVEVADRGFQYGDGVFETIACRQGRLQLWPEHLHRLQQACDRLGLHMPDESTWLADIEKLQLKGDAVVKLILTRGVSGRGYAYDASSEVTRVVSVSPWPAYPEQNRQGVTVRFCETPVSINTALAGIKHLNRLDNVLARNEWQDPEIAEGIMLDHHQHVIEGTMSNIFCVLDHELYTPSLARSGVAGVMRDQVIQLAERMNLTVNIVEISQYNFLNMDALFLTNSLIGLWPISRVRDNERRYDFAASALVSDLQRELNRVLEHNK